MKPGEFSIPVNSQGETPQGIPAAWTQLDNVLVWIPPEVIKEGRQQKMC